MSASRRGVSPGGQRMRRRQFITLLGGARVATRSAGAAGGDAGDRITDSAGLA